MVGRLEDQAGACPIIRAAAAALTHAEELGITRPEARLQYLAERLDAAANNSDQKPEERIAYIHARLLVNRILK